MIIILNWSTDLLKTCSLLLSEWEKGRGREKLREGNGGKKQYMCFTKKMAFKNGSVVFCGLASISWCLRQAGKSVFLHTGFWDTCGPHPESPSHLSPHTIPLCHPSSPALTDSVVKWYCDLQTHWWASFSHLSAYIGTRLYYIGCFGGHRVIPEKLSVLYNAFFSMVDIWFP